MRNIRERRVHDRFLCSSLVKLSVISSDGSELVLTAVAEDISESGISLLSEEPVRPGEFVSFESGGQTYHGELVHCNLLEDGSFRLGMRFESSWWDETSDWPETRLRFPADQRGFDAQ